MPLLVCPNCNVGMTPVQRSGVELDVCPQCRGVWLDRGELEKLLQPLREPEPAAPASFLSPSPSPSPWSQRVPEPGSYRHHGHDEHHGHHERHGEHHQKHKGWRNILDVFD